MKDMAEKIARLCYNTVIASNGCFMQQNKGGSQNTFICVCSTEDGPLGALML